MKKGLIIAVAVLCGAFSVDLKRVHAEGALAVGSTGNVAKDGIAYGGAYGHATQAKAVEAAIRTCRNYKNAERASAKCKLVATFKGECYATANDPKPGTPGTGWAIALEKDAAEERALAACRTSAGDRADKCVIDGSYCDKSD